MLIFNGITKKKCSLVNGAIVVGGMSYSIKCVKEVEDFDVKNSLGIFVFVVSGIIIVFGLASSRDNVFTVLKSIFYGNIDIGIIFGVFLFNVIPLAVWLFFFRYPIVLRGYSSYWIVTINKKLFLLLEKEDGPEARSSLERLKQDNLT